MSPRESVARDDPYQVSDWAMISVPIVVVEPGRSASARVAETPSAAGSMADAPMTPFSADWGGTPSPLTRGAAWQDVSSPMVRRGFEPPGDAELARQLQQQDD